MEVTHTMTLKTEILRIDGAEHIMSWFNDCNACMKHYYTIMEAMEECVIILDVDNEHRRSLLYDIQQHMDQKHEAAK